MLFLLNDTVNIFLLTSKHRGSKIKSIVFLINSQRHITSVSRMTSAGSLCRLMIFSLPDRTTDLPSSWSHSTTLFSVHAACLKYCDTSWFLLWKIRIIQQGSLFIILQRRIIPFHRIIISSFFGHHTECYQPPCLPLKLILPSSSSPSCFFFGGGACFLHESESLWED